VSWSASEHEGCLFLLAIAQPATNGSGSSNRESNPK
jgi:hypothetical protein